jgi:CIC family chloride channel protein
MELVAAGTSLNQPAGSYAEPELLVLEPDASVWMAMSEMEDFVGESIPVLEEGRLVGVLFESTIVSAYLEILEEIRREENAAL